MQYINFDFLTSNQSYLIYNLLINSPRTYSRYFTPFPFEVNAIEMSLDKALKDKFIAINLVNNVTTNLIGFYMLRGLDEGYKEPMYGIFVSHEHSSKGIAQLSIAHAECLCKLNGFKELLLKVHKENYRAKNLYQFLGFKVIQNNYSDSNILMKKNLLLKYKNDK